ncbi:hypothetical protein AVEN_192823-1 [Araneus ventricosus]|uniref:Uncharacterized protein n=1 Tax=Araneus ventricosus TaxID=182803 RepID=A0A4Y2WCH6_ARAVE|nr:hypothetical protein AVEN_192823-1 [Araneus ventricosus]
MERNNVTVYKEKLLAIDVIETFYRTARSTKKANICVHQAVEDAYDCRDTAISVAPQYYDYVRVVGEDIDLLVLPNCIVIDTQ